MQQQAIAPRFANLKSYVSQTTKASLHYQNAFTKICSVETSRTSLVGNRCDLSNLSAVFPRQ
ncbi:hypothetical protein RBSH_02691 [Rhodopirellula baltica SH28]|uniref:Uncharacterized protein n=1 Tax=Rhodopirellula baltica SH28 TaxID=993517 RepID=K5DHQ8_RHOBT|nr:hypothetical protein RBSH_02691 [Rhodopirellula baltica SH28]